MREAGWEPEEQGPPAESGPTDPIGDILLKLVEMGAKLDRALAGIKLLYQTATGAQTAQNRGPPPQRAQEAPRAAPPQNGGRPYQRSSPPPQRARQEPLRPGDGPPQAEERWFGPQLLDDQIQFGKKWRGFRWGDLLASPEGREYLTWLAGTNVAESGRNPNSWKGPSGRAALWLLEFGDRYAGQAQQEPPRGAAQTRGPDGELREDVPF